MICLQSHSEPFVPHVVKGNKNILILSDIHFPYHDQVALNAAIKEGIKRKCTLVILNGDTLDCYTMSVFNKRPDKADMSIEFEMARDFINLMRKTFKNVLFKTGNHEERWEQFLMRNPAIFGVDQFSLKSILGLSDKEYVTDRRIINIGKLNVIHGHEIGKGIFNPVNFARTLMVKGGSYTLAGHCHQVSSQPFTRIDGDVINCWSTGCLCELRPHYMPVNQWQHGFAIIHVDNGFTVSNHTIKNGKIY